MPLPETGEHTAARQQAGAGRRLVRLPAALLGAALGGMSVVLLSSQHGPALTSGLSVPALFGYLGLLFSVMLILRVIVTIARDRTP